MDATTPQAAYEAPSVNDLGSFRDLTQSKKSNEADFQGASEGFDPSRLPSSF